MSTTGRAAVDGGATRATPSCMHTLVAAAGPPHQCGDAAIVVATHADVLVGSVEVLARRRLCGRRRCVGARAVIAPKARPRLRPSLLPCTGLVGRLLVVRVGQVVYECRIERDRWHCRIQPSERLRTRVLLGFAVPKPRTTTPTRPSPVTTPSAGAPTPVPTLAARLWPRWRTSPWATATRRAVTACLSRRRTPVAFHVVWTQHGHAYMQQLVTV